MTRIAIIGLGPKGLFALERLSHHARTLPTGAVIEVDAYEPHPVPGAGPVYDPGQPDYLRMNFQAEQVDLWWPETTAVPPQRGLPFTAWRGTEPGEAYPPRAEVGRYLADGLAAVLAHAPASLRVQIIPAAIHDLDDVAGYDEVLLATGHEPTWSGALAASWSHAVPLVPAVFPVTRWLVPSAVAPGQTVAARGFALTFIDAALALTEGRGGTFEHDETGLRYEASGDDVGLLLPFSRTGRPMLAKPARGAIAVSAAADRAAALGREMILALPRDLTVERHLLPVIAATARAALAADAPLATWLTGAMRDAVPPADCDPREELARSLEVADGARAPDLGWALGHAWRVLYPAIVARFSGQGLPEAERAPFATLARHMERVAFGPPPVNVAKLIALIDAGRVSLSFVHGGRVISSDGATTLNAGELSRPVDVVLDTVLPAPGAVGGLVDQLLATGAAHVAPGRRGIEVAPDGRCLDAEGKPASRFSAIGRVTEDSVIGNDTLNRALHPLTDLWAARVVAAVREREALPV